LQKPRFFSPACKFLVPDTFNFKYSYSRRTNQIERHNVGYVHAHERMMHHASVPVGTCFPSAYHPKEGW